MENKEIKKNYFAIIPANVRYSNIPAHAKLLYGEITALCNEKGYCWASNTYFAKLYKKNRATISTWVRVLRDNNFIEYEIKDKSTRRIFLIGCHENTIGVLEKSNRGVLEKHDHNNTIINNKYNSKQKITLRAQLEFALDGSLKDKEEMDAFISYWTEKSPGGKKERWEKQPTFDIKRRWATWMRNKKTNFGRNGGVLILHDGTKARQINGRWVDAQDMNVRIDPHYYPEITKV